MSSVETSMTKMWHNWNLQIVAKKLCLTPAWKSNWFKSCCFLLYWVESRRLCLQAFLVPLLGNWEWLLSKKNILRLWLWQNLRCWSDCGINITLFYIVVDSCVGGTLSKITEWWLKTERGSYVRARVANKNQLIPYPFFRLTSAIC